MNRLFEIPVGRLYTNRHGKPEIDQRKGLLYGHAHDGVVRVSWQDVLSGVDEEVSEMLSFISF